MFCLISAAELVGVKIWYAHVKALGMRMRKLVLFFSVAQILPEKINKMDFLNSLEFIDVSQTVPGIFFNIFIIPDNLVLGPMKICSLEKCPLLQFFRYFAVRYFEFLLWSSRVLHTTEARGWIFTQEFVLIFNVGIFEQVGAIFREI